MTDETEHVFTVRVRESESQLRPGETLFETTLDKNDAPVLARVAATVRMVLSLSGNNAHGFEAGLQEICQMAREARAERLARQ